MIVSTSTNESLFVRGVLVNLILYHNDECQNPGQIYSPMNATTSIKFITTETRSVPLRNVIPHLMYFLLFGIKIHSLPMTPTLLSFLSTNRVLNNVPITF